MVCLSSKLVRLKQPVEREAGLGSVWLGGGRWALTLFSNKAPFKPKGGFFLEWGTPIGLIGLMYFRETTKGHPPMLRENACDAALLHPYPGLRKGPLLRLSNAIVYWAKTPFEPGLGTLRKVDVGTPHGHCMVRLLRSKLAIQTERTAEFHPCWSGQGNRE